MNNLLKRKIIARQFHVGKLYRTILRVGRMNVMRTTLTGQQVFLVSCPTASQMRFNKYFDSYIVAECHFSIKSQFIYFSTFTILYF